MAAASNPTKRSSNDSRQKMIKKIADAREDIKLIYEESKKSLLLELEKLTQKADDISEKPQFDEKELEQIADKVEQIKENAKSRVPPAQDSSAKSSDASDDKPRDIPIEDDKWPMLEMDLEKILENTAVKYKHDDYTNVLDGILKNCLLCLAIFPQDATIQKRTLIYWWIGEGFVNATGTKTAEEVGEIYFEELLEGSWIYAVNNRSSPNVREFKMDPWVRWLVIYLAREEGFFNLDKTGMPYSSPSKYRQCLLKNKNEPTSQEPIESSHGEKNPANQEGSTRSLLKALSNQEGSIKTSHGESNPSNQEGSTKPSQVERNNSNKEGSTKGHPKILSAFNANVERLCTQKLFRTSKEMKSLEGSTKGHPKWQSKILSVFNVNAERLRAQDLFQDFKEMKSLLVMHLGRWQTSIEATKRHIEFEDEDSELLECLHKLSLPIRLRYLSFAGISRITKLPTAVKDLSYLKILDLRSCQNLEHLREEVISLKSLTHLDVSECYMLDHMPKGLGTLSQLEVLKGFIFGSLRSEDPCRLAELTKLKKLRKLSISIGGEAQIQPKEMTKLKDINGLRSLAITWGKLSQTLPADAKKTLEENWIEWTSFPSNLEKLDLRCFPKENVFLDPKLKKLKKLYIRGGQVEDISIIAEAESDQKMEVEMIRLKFLNKLALKGKWSELKKCSELKKWFPVLNYLEIHKCPHLEDISELHNNVWMEEPTQENNCDTAVTSAPLSTDDTNTTTDVPAEPPAKPSSESPVVPPSTDTNTTTDVPADPPAKPSSESPVVPSPTGNVPTSTDTSVGEADGATTTSASKTPKSSSTNKTEVLAAPPDIHDQAHITTDNSSPTTNITSSSAAPSGLAHSTSITPTSSSLATSADVDTSTPASATSSSQTPSHPTSPTKTAHDSPTPTDPSNSLSSLDKGYVVADSTSITPKSSSIDTTEVVRPLDISDRAPIPTDNSSTTTNNTSSSPAPVAPSGLTHSTTTPTSSSLATSAAVVPSANTSTPTPAIQSEDTTLTTTRNTSSSQTPPHPTSPTTDVADSSSITPTSSSPVEQNNASIPESARDQDTSAASIDTVVTHPPGEPVLASTVSTTVSKTLSPASLSATATGTTASLT